MRILLKISGETLGNKAAPWQAESLSRVAAVFKLLHEHKHEVAVVVGGGNVWRYRDQKDIPLERKPSDYLGMLATIFNANCLKAAANSIGLKAEVLSHLKAPDEVCIPYNQTLAEDLLKQGTILCLAGGTGRSGFTTDTGAAMSAQELHCDEIWKATKVNGVFTSDPNTDPSAKLLPRVSYADYLSQALGVMDQEAIQISQSSGIPIRVFQFSLSHFSQILAGENTGSLID